MWHILFNMYINTYMKNAWTYTTQIHEFIFEVGNLEISFPCDQQSDS